MGREGQEPGVKGKGMSKWQVPQLFPELCGSRGEDIAVQDLLDGGNVYFRQETLVV